MTNESKQQQGKAPQYVGIVQLIPAESFGTVRMKAHNDTAKLLLNLVNDDRQKPRTTFSKGMIAACKALGYKVEQVKLVVSTDETEEL